MESKEIQELVKTINDIKLSVTRIETCILGDESIGIDGMVKEVADLHNRLVSLEKDRAKVITVTGTISAIVGFVAAWLFKHL